jgi:hypothetical protein
MRRSSSSLLKAKVAITGIVRTYAKVLTGEIIEFLIDFTRKEIEYVQEKMSEEKGKLRGGCVCGAVTYEAVIDKPQLDIVYCHCKDCQEAHSAPYIGAVLLAESSLTWNGLDNVLKYDRRGTNLRLFCKTCGVHVCCHKQKYKMYALFPSTFKECTVPMKSAMHIMCKEKDPYITLPDDGLPHLDGFPS